MSVLRVVIAEDRAMCRVLMFSLDRASLSVVDSEDCESANIEREIRENREKS